jgi:thiol-disulfide isomerase/thioredoxin
MKSGGKWLLVAAVAIAAAWAGVEFGRWSRGVEAPGPADQRSGDAVTQLLAMPLMLASGQPKKLSDWQGKVLVVNFWATWCPPCREEMPEFSLAQNKFGANGIQFVGIAIDSVNNVVEFSKTTPVTYPLLIASSDMPSLIARLGNTLQVLPFTIFINREGKLVSSHLGRLSREDIEKQLASLHL